MKRIYLFSFLALIISLYIYAVYRTENTVINQLISWAGLDAQEWMKTLRGHASDLPDWMVYSLPEGLWILSISLWSRGLKWKWRGRQLPLVILPLMYAIGLELLQLVHLTNGRFDVIDLLLSSFFWLLAFTVPHEQQEGSSTTPWSARHISLALGYAMVILSDVVTVA